jgi:hypothetical protein
MFAAGGARAAKEAGEEVGQGRRRNRVCQVGPTVEFGAASQTPQFDFGVLEWSELRSEFWSGGAPPRVGAIPNRPLAKNQCTQRC